MKEKKYYLNKLNKILEKARISKDLREAVEEIKKAIEAGDVELAADLASVKSFIVGTLKKDKRFNNHFREDSEYNEKILGQDVYDILDEIAYDYALATDQLPPGMLIITSGGSYAREIPKKRNRILKLMKKEEEEINKKLREKA